MARYRIVIKEWSDGKTTYHPQVRILGTFWKGVGVHQTEIGFAYDYNTMWESTAGTILSAFDAIIRHIREHDRDRIVKKHIEYENCLINPTIRDIKNIINYIKEH